MKTPNTFTDEEVNSSIQHILDLNDEYVRATLSIPKDEIVVQKQKDLLFRAIKNELINRKDKNK